MDWQKELFSKDEKPLDRLVDGYSHTSVFRTMAFIGDSLSSGEFETRNEKGEPGWHDLYEYSWGQYIARKNGLKAYNFSKGGMTAKVFVEHYAEDSGFFDKDKAAQGYVIAMGVNDINNKEIPIGDISDINDITTYIGSYAEIVRRFKKISPDAKFFFVTLPKTDEFSDTEKYLAANEAIMTLGEYFENAYVIDLYKYAPVYDAAFKEKFFLYGHMNPHGYIFTARMIDSYIDYIVRHNVEDFQTVGFIGTDIKYKFQVKQYEQNF